MPDWCSKHNREMLPSKFGGVWCPDCSKEKKQQKGFQPIMKNEHEEIIEALRKLWVKLEEIEKKIK